MSKEARLIAAVVAAVVVIVGGLVLFSGGDDAEVNASDTTDETSTTAEDNPSSSAAADTTTSAPDGGSSTTAAAADSGQPAVTTGATSGADGASTTGGASTGAADGAGDTGGAATTGGAAAGQPSVSDLATWQTDLPPSTVRDRFDAAEASNDRCVRLIALTSLPDLNDLPAQSKAEINEYFTRWQRLADLTQPQTNGLTAARLIEARNALKNIENTVNQNGGTFNEAAVDELLGGSSNDLETLLGFFTTVADECPGPAA
ncbi:MAG: hypothetical protein R2754_00495 [Microthrixaceae bacterium]